MRILGLGDNVVDRYLNHKVMFPGGNAVNVAAHSAKLGAEAAYLGRIADDLEGKMLVNALQDLHVDLSHCEIVAGGTTKRCDVNVYEGERSFVGVDLGEAWPGAPLISEDDIAYMNTFDLIHSSCNAKMPEQMVKLKDCPGLVSFDFGEKEKYRVDEYLDKICPYTDLALCSCDSMSLEKRKALAVKLYQKGMNVVLLTSGSVGPLVYNGSGFVQGAVEYVKPVDTMGAGDSFLAAFMVSLLKQGWKKNSTPTESMLQEALKQGALYAAQNCLIEGGFGYKNTY